MLQAQLYNGYILHCVSQDHNSPRAALNLAVTELTLRLDPGDQVPRHVLRLE